MHPGNLANRPPLGLKGAKPRRSAQASAAPLRQAAKGQTCTLRLPCAERGFTSGSQGLSVGQRAECFQHIDAPNRNGTHEVHVMASKPLPSPEVLRQYFDFCPDTGEVFRKDTGRITGLTVTTHGYRTLSFRGRQIYAHRIAWALHHGAWPVGVIDHINQDKQDNRISNLRDVDNRENLRNQRRSKANRSGTTGVHFCSNYNLWVAQIKGPHGGVHLGRYDTLAEAKAARRAAEICFQYSEGHGKP